MSLYDAFFTLVDQQINLSPLEKRKLELAFVVRHVPKRYTLVKEGDVAQELYFINKGLIRLFYTKEIEEITGFIFKEHLFAASYESYLRQSPSVQTLETLEECELLVISKERMEQLYVEVPAINILTRKIAEQRFINAQQLFTSYIMETPEERYLKFMHQHPDLMQRVPLQIIASFLGITPVSLSRIRKRIVK